MKKPLIVLSYSWLRYNHKDFTDEELDTAIYGVGAALVHIQDDENCDARFSRSESRGNPQARVRPFIQKAVAEGRFARVLSKEDFNVFFARFDIPPLGEDVDDQFGCVYRGDMSSHLEDLGYKVAGGCARRDRR